MYIVSNGQSSLHFNNTRLSNIISINATMLVAVVHVSSLLFCTLQSNLFKVLILVFSAVTHASIQLSVHAPKYCLFPSLSFSSGVWCKIMIL